MSLFLNTSNLHNRLHDCLNIDVSETIERECLSVLHKLHDQVNGLQLVQVVVQPLAKLFSQASLHALVSNVPTTPSSTHSSSTFALPQSHATTPTSQNSVQYITQNNDLEGIPASSSVRSGHSRGQSFVSTNSNVPSLGNNSLASTYMMSPDTAQALIARLDTDRDINWLMEIIGYGLSMPFLLTGEQDSVKDCCTIYCEWLSAALLPYNEQSDDKKYQQLSKLVPVPIRNDPNRYARKMLSHLYNVFLPRQTLNLTSANPNQRDQPDAHLTDVSRQAVLCHRVLRTIENIAHNPSNLLDDKTWDHLLALLLTVNNKLLSGPTEPDDIGTQLQDRILGVLFELMLLASSRAIPTPGLWKAFSEMCLNWRHRPGLVDHWRRITLLLTRRLVQYPFAISRCSTSQDQDSIVSHSYDAPNFSHASSASAIETAIFTMSQDTLVQTWYKFLTLIGNPVDLSDPDVISRTDEFYHSVCASNSVLDPRQHSCLNVLPQIFLNSMIGIKDIVESFLGSYQPLSEEKNEDNRRMSPRGSVISLGNYPTSMQQSSSIQQVQPQPQSQAVTPTQSRKSGGKAISIKGSKGVLPTVVQSGSQSTGPPQVSDPVQTHEHPKSGSFSGQNLAQPRPSLTSISSRTSQQKQQLQFKLSADRPLCNSILHIFGDWLFSAALIGSELNQEVGEFNDGNQSESTSIASTSTTTEISGCVTSTVTSGKRRSSKSKLSVPTILAGIRSHSHSSKQSESQTNSQPDEMILKSQWLEGPLTPEAFELGQAEATAILCRIFSSKAASETISQNYLSRFYLCLQHCLAFGSKQTESKNQGQTNAPIKRQLLASALINSTSLLQKDLDGINLLIPSFIKAIEFVFEFNEREAPIQAPPRQHNRVNSMRSNSNYNSSITNYDLRRACIMTLINLLSYPSHFKDLVIRNCLNDSAPTTTFGSLRQKLIRLLFMALQTETDPTNMQLLFAGLTLTMHNLSSDIETSAKDESSRSKNHNDSAKKPVVTPHDIDGSHHNTQGDTTSQDGFVYNSIEGLIIKSLHVTCHLLLNVWKHDTHVSLAAIELLTAIARISTSVGATNCAPIPSNCQAETNDINHGIDMNIEYKQTTRWLCDYICNQCSRPPPAHSRDMHSTIVAAYHCLSVWFCHHPSLLLEERCINTVLEVIELGVTGQKSKSLSINPTTGASSQIVINKNAKAMKPSSMRVREAAESLLNICMVRSRELNEQDSAQSFDTVLDELLLADIYGGSQYKADTRLIVDPNHRRMEAYKLFKYFSDEDSIIFGLLQCPSTDSSTKDAAICLLRTPFGKHCWLTKFSYYTGKTREKIIANKTLGLIKRPFQQCTPVTNEARVISFPTGQNKSLYFNSNAKFFPDTIENLASNELDNLVPPLSDYMSSRNPHLRQKLSKLGRMFTHQVLAEQEVISDCSMRSKRIDCEEPQHTTDLEVTRLLVTHFGLHTSLQSMANGADVTDSFAKGLRSLDCQSTRICDAVNVYYVRKNRTSLDEILESTRERRNVNIEFFEWLLELGYPTIVKNHSRWTGKESTSWNSNNVSSLGNDSIPLARNQMLCTDHGGSIFDGDRLTLYWADMCQELAFLVPQKLGQSDCSIMICWLECADDLPEVPCDKLMHQQDPCDSSRYSSGRSDIFDKNESTTNKGPSNQQGAALSHKAQQPHQTPIKKEFAKYFISPMKNGLYRINLVTSVGRQWLALPIVDNMTVSREILSSMIRESILNTCRRRRLDADSYQPPHVRRRLKIQEICSAHRVSNQQKSTEFHHYIFKNSRLAKTKAA